MNDAFQCDEYQIEKLEVEKEMNFIVTKNGDYVCRLIPGHNGFELSPLDKAVGNLVDANLVDKIAKRILDYYD